MRPLCETDVEMIPWGYCVPCYSSGKVRRFLPNVPLLVITWSNPYPSLIVQVSCYEIVMCVLWSLHQSYFLEAFQLKLSICFCVFAEPIAQGLKCDGSHLTIRSRYVRLISVDSYITIQIRHCIWMHTHNTRNYQHSSNSSSISHFTISKANLNVKALFLAAGER